MRVGGQAVIEGVLMRSPNYTSIATTKNNKIKVKTIKNNPLIKKYEKVLFLRGIIYLIDMLILGIRSLSYSAKELSGEKEKITGWDIFFSIFLAFIFSIGLFIIIPFYLAKAFSSNIFIFNLIDGLFRVIIFILYIAIIGKLSDIKRVFQYHGAEHKTIACYEDKKALNLKNIRKFSTLHRRCGTSFLLIVLILSIIIFSLIISDSTLVKILARIILIPVIASISYEIIRLEDKYNKFFLLNILIYPGLMLQKITTKEPDANQIKVAVKALSSIIKREKE
ncbi:MAG TPA: DUF1385 domain-containing protein [Candidatus Nanoarchaeia archaeon]|nr:DUF1385 domain-containing protein [Candidatus Nanoarchaeia archaeon]